MDYSGSDTMTSKNSPRWRILSLLVLAAVAGWALWSATRAKPIRSIAVFPLKEASREGSQAFFADGLTEQLTALLSQIGSLRVISYSSAVRYGTPNPALADIGKRWNVDAVVEGTISLTGDRLRLTTQLVQAANAKPLWTQSYDRDQRDVPVLLGEVASDVATHAGVALTAREQTLLRNQRPVEAEAFQLYLQGRFSLNQASEEALRTSIEFFEEAIARDASYAPAYSGEARAYVNLASVFAAPRTVMPQAKTAAEKALQLDETLSEAHATLAFVRMMFDWDWPGAESEIKRAIEINPNSADAHDLYGNYFTALQQYPEAIAESRRAHELDPLSLRIYGDLLSNLVVSRQYDQTIGECRKALQTDPQFATAHAVMGLAYSQKKQFPEALAALKRATELDPSPTLQIYRASVEAAAGNKAEAQKLVSNVEDLSRRQYICAYEIGHVYVSLGDRDKAVQWLERGRQERADCMVWLMAEPWMDPLRVDPRYLGLVKQIGFPVK